MYSENSRRECEVCDTGEAEEDRNIGLIKDVWEILIRFVRYSNCGSDLRPFAKNSRELPPCQ
jgi:hypothetical protein